jgi:hypothetical protein
VCVFHAPESFLTQPACGFHVCFLHLPHFDSMRFQKVTMCPVDERPPLGGAWFSRASRDGSHPIFLYHSSVVYLTVFVLFGVFLVCVTFLQRFLAVFDLWLWLFEPFCHLKSLLATLGKTRLVCDSSGIIGDNHCLLLLCVCFVWLLFPLGNSFFVVVGFIVGEPPFFVCRGSSTSSSFRIRSGKDSLL